MYLIRAETAVITTGSAVEISFFNLVTVKLFFVTGYVLRLWKFTNKFIAVIGWIQYIRGRRPCAPTGFSIDWLYLIQVHTAIILFQNL
jgi:hypothetical protein